MKMKPMNPNRWMKTEKIYIQTIDTQLMYKVLPLPIPVKK